MKMAIRQILCAQKKGGMCIVQERNFDTIAFEVKIPILTTAFLNYNKYLIKFHKISNFWLFQISIDKKYIKKKINYFKEFIV